MKNFFREENITSTNTYNYNQTYYYEFNLQGDVIALYNAAGNLYATYKYDAWGKLLGVYDSEGDAITSSTSIGIMNPIRYRGYIYDTETGFYYLQSRYYDPEVGRFINLDAYVNANGDFIGYNMYAYCSNNPVNCFDPTGYGCYDSVTGTWVPDTMPQSDTEWDNIDGEVDADVNNDGEVNEEDADWVKKKSSGGQKPPSVKIPIRRFKLSELLNLFSSASSGSTSVAAASSSTTSTSSTSSVHGNSLACTSVNYGYQLLDSNNNILKYGETIHPYTRYSYRWLNANGYSMQVVAFGDKASVHQWQHIMILSYESVADQRPPLNKSYW